MKLVDAMRAGEKDPDVPQPINGGRCEAPAEGYPRWVNCSAPARWWYRSQFRCTKHKTA